jgi:SHS2 domain-containing protein
MEREFDIISHTADVGIKVYGADRKQVFANSAKALFYLITDLDNVEEMLYRDIKVTAINQEDLLVGWLNELIFVFDVENLVFKRFRVKKLYNTKLEARCYGEKVDNSRHEIKTGVKAATYHMLKIEKDDGYKAQVLFDV